MAGRSYHHGDLRNSLIENGIEFINQEGVKQLSLRKVAALCGVSQAAPYSHFKSKEALLEAMRDYVTAQFMDILEKAIQSCSNPNDPSVLIQIGKSYVLFFIHHPQYFTFLFSQSGAKINLSMKNDDSNNFSPFELFKTIAWRILGTGGLPEEKRKDAVISMWATVHGLASIATMKNVYYDEDWQSKIEDIIWRK
ncbi:MAG TPA: TetR family transcriptional regulator [Firmicutes bacterium]|jgi:AcrR family transcriptional regulator|nr:TetR family transcriptional regulator [Bacillota bacterium]